MNSSQLKDLIGQKRPRYKEKYRPLIDSISTRGDQTGKGNFSTLGPFYQTYMYAFIVGYKLGKQDFIKTGEKASDFFVLSQWSPTTIRDYVVMLLLNKSNDFGFTWLELENANEEAVNTFVSELIHQMEGYANAGLEYLQAKWDNEKMEFHDPFVFVNFLEELSN